MIKLRAEDQSEMGGQSFASFMVGSKFLDIYTTSDSDRWVRMMDDNAMLNARFRSTMNGSGGKSPNVLHAITCVIDAAQTCPIEQQPLLPHTTHNFTASRAEEEMGMRLTAKLQATSLLLSLCDPHGRQADPDTVIDIEFPISECPPRVQSALWVLPYAMLLDNGLTMRNGNVVPTRSPADRTKLSWCDEAHLQHYRVS